MRRFAPWRLLGFVLGAAAVAAVDQYTKALIVAHRHALPITVIPGCFNLIYGENTGVAFGMLQGMGPALLLPMAAGCVIVCYLLYQELRAPRSTVGVVPALALILGGAVGNLIDRLRLGYVVDFIDWHYGGYHWYTFNVADAAITSGVGVLVAATLLWGKKSAACAAPHPEMTRTPK